MLQCHSDICSDKAIVNTKNENIEWIALIKAILLTNGVRLSPSIRQDVLDRPIYSVVTNGIDIEYSCGVIVNAPLNSKSPVLLNQIDDKVFLYINNQEIPASILPVAQSLFYKIPGTAQVVSDYCYIGTDRINIWAVESCALAVQNKACKFCDVGHEGISYGRQPLDKIKYALKAIQDDKDLPVRHIQVTGGTPIPNDWDHFIAVCELSVHTGMPVSAMLSLGAPQSVFDSLRSIGVSELALNIEFVSEDIRIKLTPGKSKNIWERLEMIAGQWPKASVRSALVIGPESQETTIDGINRLLGYGVIPILSPFRPAKGTPMENQTAPNAEFLFSIYMEALEIANKNGLFIGPSCRYCQNNVMALPLDVGISNQHKQ